MLSWAWRCCIGQPLATIKIVSEEWKFWQVLGRREREEREVIPEPRGFFVRVDLGKTERNEAVQILLHEGDLVKKKNLLSPEQ